jgi:hypothetical protein
MKRPWGLKVVWAVLPFALIAFGFGAQPLKSWDYWWHIAFGRQIADTMQMPIHNHFLYTLPADHSAYVQPWLAQWAMFLVHDTFGLQGMLLLRNLLAIFAFTILGYWASKRSGAVAVGSLLALAASAFGFFTIAARSEIFAWPMFLALVPLAYSLRHGQIRHIALLAFPFSAALWANLHGTFVVPAAVCFAFAGADFADRYFKVSARSEEFLKAGGPHWMVWALTAVASMLAALLNPRGTDVYGYLWLMSTNAELRETVTEWWPTTPFYPDFFGAYFWAIFLGSLFLFWRNRERLDFADLGMLLWIALLTIPQTRFMLWFGLTLPVVVSPYLTGLASQFKDESTPSPLMQNAHMALAVGLVAVAVWVQPWGSSNSLAAEVQAAPTRITEPLLGLVLDDVPIEAAELVKARFTHTPRVFHDHRYPGFLIFWLGTSTPEQMVFVDNRIELPPQSLWREFDTIGNGIGWQEAFQRYGIEAVVTGYRHQAGLIKALKESTTWECPFDNTRYVACFPKHRP